MPTTPADSIELMLNADQLAHTQAMREQLRRMIATRGGWIGFDEYLNQVLYAPGLGYYSAGATKFGAAGDFITAPELSPLFAGCIARHSVSSQPGDTILELGAGSGALAADLLTRLEQLGALPQHYLILEVSGDLRERQRRRIATLAPVVASRVEWLDRLPQAPIRGLILANEVADALPFKRAVWRNAAWHELGVSIQDGDPGWSEREPAVELLAELARVLPDPAGERVEGFVVEICPALDGWIAAVSGALERGAMLLLDYGLGRSELYHPARIAGTLRCHYRHRAHDDPFLHPGLQDITAWVDFTRVAEAATESGLQIASYSTQAAFLLANQIDAELAYATDNAATARMVLQRRSEVQRLLLPGEMGESFKAMCLTRGLAGNSGDNEIQDLRRLL
jgi:SAM-dependent MidA family methyltransferase